MENGPARARPALDRLLRDRPRKANLLDLAVVGGPNRVHVRQQEMRSAGPSLSKSTNRNSTLGLNQ